MPTGPLNRVIPDLLADLGPGGGGADADADADADGTAATDPPEHTTPRRASRLARSALALASRLATLPSGMPNCRAASRRVRPPRSSQGVAHLHRPRPRRRVGRLPPAHPWLVLSR
jgi:hypothetical protein